MIVGIDPQQVDAAPWLKVDTTASLTARSYYVLIARVGVSTAFPQTKRARGRSMRMVAEYLEQAHLFERLAASEADPKNKAQLEGQAQAYYKLAQKRARNLGRPMPEGPPQSR